jgi:hypothetical protein
MEINSELIQKFFENKCDSNEREAVVHYLSCHPEEVKRLFPFGEWEEISATQYLPQSISAEMRKNIMGKIFYRRQLTLHIVIRRVTIAASVLILLSGITLFLFNKQQRNSRRPAVTTVNHPPVSIAPEWVKHVNNSGNPMAILLPDGSYVHLQEFSSLQYQSSAFGVKRRNVYLEGGAFFEVITQRNKPFSVFAGSLCTTVLGTTFRINVSGRNIGVKLYTGKVVVSSVGDLHGWKGDIYLSPGEQLNYDKLNAQVTFNRSKTGLAQPSPAGLAVKGEQQSEFDFNNVSLKEIIDLLSRIHNNKIIYNSEDIAGMNFTGTISRSDSLEVVLKLIAAMNDLSVQKVENTYIISKSQK